MSSSADLSANAAENVRLRQKSANNAASETKDPAPTSPHASDSKDGTAPKEKKTFGRTPDGTSK